MKAVITNPDLHFSLLKPLACSFYSYTMLQNVSSTSKCIHIFQAGRRKKAATSVGGTLKRRPSSPRIPQVAKHLPKCVTWLLLTPKGGWKLCLSAEILLGEKEERMLLDRQRVLINLKGETGFLTVAYKHMEMLGKKKNLSCYFFFPTLTRGGNLFY